jgi:hypothetical protein
MGCVDGGGHQWLLDEVLVEANAADTTSTCARCGATGYQAGQGRTTRPGLPDVELTRDELPPAATRRPV